MLNEQEFLAMTEQAALTLYRVARVMLRNEADCQDAYQETMFKAYVFNAPPDRREFLEQRMTDTLQKYETLGRAPTEVVVRFLLHDVPIHTVNSWSPGQSGITSDGNPVPFARFVVTKEGKICFVFIRFWFEEQKFQPDTRPHLPWQDILTGALTIPWEEYHQPQQDARLWLRAVEPLLSVDEKGLTFPVWRLMLEQENLKDRRDFPDQPESFYYWEYSFTFDANTGVQR